MAFSPAHASIEGFRTIKRSPVSFLVWLLAVTAAAAALVAAGYGLLADDFVHIGVTHHMDEADALSFLQKIGGAVAALLVILIIASAILYNAVFRAVLRPAERGAAYLRFGGDELRTIGLFVLLSVLGLGFMALVVGAIVGVSHSDAPLALKVLFGIAAGLGGFILLIWVKIRIIPALPLVVAEHRISLGRAWRLSRGQFWPLLGMVLLLVVICLVLQMVGRAFIGPMMLPVTGGWPPMIHGADALNDMVDALTGNLGLVAGVALIAVISHTLQLVMYASSYAAAYRDLSATDSAEPV